MLSSKKYPKDQALKKAQQFCAYQERSHMEVRDKLYRFGLRKQEVEELMAKLIEDDFLNEERFAIAFARGKFRMNQWGRRKIMAALRQKKVSTYCINKSLGRIDEQEYATTTKKLAMKKWATLKGDENRIKGIKTAAYLLQKGFEPEIIQLALQPLLKEKNL